MAFATSTQNPNVLPYLNFGGVELNGAMTWEYILHGFQLDHRFLVTSGHGGVTAPAPILYNDPITDVPRTFTSPIADPAPWYDSTFPESAHFLGLWIENIEGLGSMLARNIDTRIAGAGGGVLGPLRSMERKLTVTATMFAASEAGMDYGIRWLTDVLQGNLSNPCQPVNIDIRTAPPPTGMADNTARWWLYNVGLLSGPTFGDPPVDGIPDKIRPITFTIASELPWMYHLPTTQSLTTLYPSGPGCEQICDWLLDYQTLKQNIVCPSAIGETCAIVTFKSGTEDSGFELVVRSNPSQTTLAAFDPFPDPPTDPTVEFSYKAFGIPAGGTLVIDASTKTITFTDASGNVMDGTRYIQVPEGQPINWPTARKTTGITLDIIVPRSRVNFTTQASVQTAYRIH